MILIDNTKKLIEFCNILKKQPFITVDSEFIREHSYYPKLCLIQVGYDGDAAIIDPMTNLDLSYFFDILQDNNIVKVFHAGRQDIEIFYNLSGKIPQNIFDTQIAAMVCGYSENIGYGNLVQSITKTELDKSCRLTDWSIRPLDESQLQYALCDVTYLVDCYKHLIKYMQRHNRLNWIDEETKNLCDEKCYNIDPQNAWLKIKHNIHSPIFLSSLKYLAEWREKRAQKFDTPRSSIIKDEILLNIASAHPKNIDELKQVRNLKSEIVNGKLGAEIIDVLTHAYANPMSAEECKKDRKNEAHIPNHEQSLYEMLKLLLKIKSQEADVVSKLIANDADLRYIILNQYENTLSMQGWRYDIFGKYAEKLCRGEISITYNPKKKCIDVK